MAGLNVRRIRGKSATHIAKTASACSVLILAVCSRVSERPTNPQTVSTPKPATAIQAPRQKSLPECPVGPILKNQLPPASRHHDVVLSWNPSTSSASPQDKALGYCLYRSNKPITANKIEECKNCELISRIPVIGTGCVDVDVEDNQTYYYAALAIQAGKQPSSFSNKTKAEIPKKAPSPHPPSAYPLCREPSLSQRGPNTSPLLNH
jgi:hypothetical protein